ncbi:G-D-S-L family lipolytic protein [Flavobacterium sp.]|jgi:lysophospholipase L1-like esterase|uniref:G-D-S-L family lipolytic protein n=1 Tax=Flavobacterium sp. TaxID=239 RepID=UPI0037BF958C
MKKLLTLLALVITLITNAQAPQGFNYQATVRNSAGALIVNQNVYFKFNVMLNSATSVPVFTETHYVPTDDLGQVNLVIGQGTATVGTFSTINWGTGNYYLGIELNTGTSYVAMGTTQLLSVPYALYANSAGNSQAATPNLADVLAVNNGANNLQIKNIADPTDAQDAVTKSYIDTQLQTQIAALQAQISAIQNPPLTSGTADFLKYVSLGDSFTAGYSDSALFIASQNNSFSNILSQQFAQVGGGDFATPLMSDNIGGLLFGGNQLLGARLYFNGTTIVPVSGNPTTEITNHLTGTYNNMGVPGAKSFHLLTSGYGNTSNISTGQANPYYARFSSSTSSTVLGDAVAQNQTFFTLWIGNNDILSYATSGGTGINQTGNSNTENYGVNDITDPNVFASTYNTILNNLTINGAKGAVANIPYVTTLPYFTAIKTNPIPGLPAATASQLNQLFTGINQIAVALGQPQRFFTIVSDDNNSATVESNPLLIYDESLQNLSSYITSQLTPALGPSTASYLGQLYGKARHASNAVSTRDYILLTSQSVIGTTQTGAPSPFNSIGISYPMEDKTVLTAVETAELKIATDAYNSTIQSLAFSNGLGFVNTNSIFNQINAGGITINGITMSSNFVTGGMFSLDGVHPSPRGYALIANKFSKAINAAYGSNLTEVNLANYQILYPSNL